MSIAAPMAPLTPTQPLFTEVLPPPGEFVMDTHGEARQAGTLGEEPRAYVNYVRQCAQRSLYYFNKVFMGGTILRPVPHKLFCDFLQVIPPRRKALLAPRDHLKTTLSMGIIPHALIQPDGDNCYFPEGMGSLSHTEGRSTRILLGSKSVDLSEQKLGFIKNWCETHPLLHGFWPHCFWRDPEKESPVWNTQELLFPRKDIFKEHTLEITGVGGTITGKRYNIFIHDDLVDEKDRYSPTTMERCYNWLIASRALFDRQEVSLELILGTHWANNDVYVRIRRDRLNVAIRKYSALYDTTTGAPYSDLPDNTPITALPSHIQPLWPERYSRAALEQLRTDMVASGRKDIFILNYLNNPLHAGVVDFDLSQFRFYETTDGNVQFDADPRDEALERAYLLPHPGDSFRGQRFTPTTQRKLLSGREMYFKFG